MVSKLAVWLAAAATAVLFLANPAVAASERISSFDSQATVALSGAVDVAETINYDFGTNDRHGIFRYFPLQTQDSQGNYYNVDAQVLSVERDGKPEPYNQRDQGNQRVFQIGNANSAISGAHVYRIQYTLASFAIKGDQGDIVRLNVTGNGWQVPIDKVTSSITATPTAIDATCYSGTAGSTAHNCAVSHSGSVTKFTADSLAAGEGLTDEVLYPAGSFSSYLTAVPPMSQNSDNSLGLGPGALVGFLASALLFLVAAAIWIGRRFVESHRKKQQTVIAEYEAPDGLKPAELGLLNDDDASMVEITATLIDLAVRGFIKITQIRPRKWYRRAEYQFDWLDAKQPLEDYEQVLVSALFAGQSTQLLTKINRSAMATAIDSIKKQLNDRLTAKGYYGKESVAAKAIDNASSRRRKGAGLFIYILAIIFIIAMFIIGGRLPGYLSILSAGLFVAALKADRLTNAGLSEWAKVEGFKLFLSVTEKDRLDFTDAPERTPELFSQLLPAAIALGVEKKWAKQFEGIDISQNLYWYSSPYGGYTPYLLAGSLSSDFAPAVASGFVPQQSSSGSFGGGFSGGGGGGGGGGSW